MLHFPISVWSSNKQSPLPPRRKKHEWGNAEAGYLPLMVILLLLALLPRSVELSGELNLHLHMAAESLREAEAEWRRTSQHSAPSLVSAGPGVGRENELLPLSSIGGTEQSGQRQGSFALHFLPIPPWRASARSWASIPNCEKQQCDPTLSFPLPDISGAKRGSGLTPTSLQQANVSLLSTFSCMVLVGQAGS